MRRRWSANYTKWDDNPVSLQHFGESAVRAYQLAMTPPTMPVVLVADGELQESPIPADANLRVPKYVVPAPPAGDQGAVNEVAKMLVAAENPVIVTSRSARTPAGLKLLVELAEVLQCAVIDQHRRMNFPSRHPLNQSWNSRGVVGNADLILGLETYDFYGVVHALGGQTKVIRGRSSSRARSWSASVRAISSTRATIRTSNVFRTSIWRLQQTLKRRFRRSSRR